MKNSTITKILSHTAIFFNADEGGYVVSFPKFPGCVTEGDTFAEAKNNATELLELWTDELEELA